jgi:hypothetical protein
MKTSDIEKLGAAWASVVNANLGEKKLDPVNDKENDKKFKDRKDKDIDNDGDVDSSDEYLHKRRAATDDAIDGGKKPAKNKDKEEGNAFTKALNAAKKKGDDEFVVAGKKYSVKEEEGDEEESDEPKKKKPFPPKKDGEEKDSEDKGEEESDDEEEKPEVAGKKDDKKKVASNAKTAEISKIGEATEELLSMFENLLGERKETKGATKPEGIMDKESPKSKEFADKHKVEVKDEEETHETAVKAGQATKAKSGKRPQDNAAGDTNVVKSTEAPVKEEHENCGTEDCCGECVETIEEKAMVVDAATQNGSVSLVDMARAHLAGEMKRDTEKEKKAYDARTKEAKAFLERMAKRRGY